MDPKRPKHTFTPLLLFREWVMRQVQKLLACLMDLAHLMPPLDSLRTLLVFPIARDFTRLYYYVFHLTEMTMVDNTSANQESQSASSSPPRIRMLFYKIFPELNIPFPPPPAPRTTQAVSINRPRRCQRQLRDTDRGHVRIRPTSPTATRNVFRSRARLVRALLSFHARINALITGGFPASEALQQTLHNSTTLQNDSRIYFFLQQILLLLLVEQGRRMGNNKLPNLTPLSMDVFDRLFRKVFPEYCIEQQQYRGKKHPRS